ncbi:phospho-sugar mutase [Sporosarcina sp. G11-34]|uniref:phospho-sugar mutase n=1 Tax=Sporosarcina sp. G11-34 TaxID=2849605 RepID=UPI0022A9BEBA|nr:phospho-sugar mutase [Sporosarcina sp. G11-34]MCZ2257309.1 phospho-sugar mutase [Sporosarcina sp. G11-34]
MSVITDTFTRWSLEDSLTDELKKDLESITGNEKEIEDRFYQYLSFGTGGMRGLLGAGTNRMNVYTMRRVAEGLGLHIKAAGEDAMRRGVVIAYDTRHYSREFALETAKTVGKYGIRVFLFKESRPTPELSFAVRHLNAYAGVVITASHNPAQYNGFKVYGEDGGQLPPDAADGIVRHMNDIEDLFLIQTADKEELLRSEELTYILEEIDDAYQECLLTLREDPDAIEAYGQDMSIVYTPLHGSGLVPVVEGLRNFGFSHVNVVSEQAVQDSSFPTVAYPNPEEREAFELAMKLGKEKDADLLLATDPDADRLGVAVKTKDGDYELLTGNQLGALLLHYLLMQKKRNGTLPENGVAMKTIVTSEFGRAAAAKFGIPTIDTLTGFKFISEKIEEFEASGECEFLFGYEESYGYLIGTFARDKDAVQAAIMTAEMAAYYKSIGKSLYEALMDLYDELGHYREALESITLTGKDGQEQIAEIMKEFRNDPPSSIAGIAVTVIEDYKAGTMRLVDGASENLTLPKADVVKYILEDGSWVCIRPSGTEPKCKIYFGVRKDSADEAEVALNALVEDIMDRVRV